jgi:hypothetical protein
MLWLTVYRTSKLARNSSWQKAFFLREPFSFCKSSRFINKNAQLGAPARAASAYPASADARYLFETQGFT